MPYRTDIVYRYDGSYPGFLCCVAECFHDKSLPQGIQPLDEPQATLFTVKVVDTNQELAGRVERSIRKKISPQALDMVRRGFLTCMDLKELRLTRFILLGYKHGAGVVEMRLQDDVHLLNKALLYLKNEAHFHVEFIRFADYGNFLAAMITPNNVVLPVIVSHFCQRFNPENFVIYDKTHGMGFRHSAGKSATGEFFFADALELPPPSEEEEKYRRLWQRFYDTIPVQGRINPKLRRGLMPKRYWPNMTEFQRTGFN